MFATAAKYISKRGFAAVAGVFFGVLLYVTVAAWRDSGEAIGLRE